MAAVLDLRMRSAWAPVTCWLGSMPARSWFQAETPMRSDKLGSRYERYSRVEKPCCSVVWPYPSTNVECRVQGGAHADGRVLPGVDGQAGPQRARARGPEGRGQGVPRRQGLAAGRRVRRGRERAEGGSAGAGQGA